MHEDNEVEFMEVEAGVTRKLDLSVDNALVTMEQLYEVTMPSHCDTFVDTCKCWSI